ncbi:hypothetical protein ACFW1M_34365, partial [Streptomyces inhibens]
MSGSGAAPAYDGVSPADAARRLLVETSERGTTPAGGAAEAVGAHAADDCRGPGGPACTGRGRPGVPLRVTLALGALTVVVGSTVLALGSPSRDPFLAAGDTPPRRSLINNTHPTILVTISFWGVWVL